ncbi:wax ester/triacylglycerol synthase domain-containing protein [Candidatus Accumulibacter sp. ACC005]|uniref:wax ester/triacylglycerol synthase domain-containing protein n=1 Tax=Candidatus Accumulibacter sp. ACC005 TaxID=2823331 RepID=UPI0025BD6697|nr:wax ester/triacylglycerol synthase domain-containing protein [Candidatus Accumulibacter sp. ACC005]
MNKLSLLDLAFFVAESAASPKHVGGLMIYKRPARSPASFVSDLYRELLSCSDVQAPFNRIIHFSLTGMPTWRESDAVDLDQHLFQHRLRRGHNGRPELYRLVSELHQPMLDLFATAMGMQPYRYGLIERAFSPFYGQDAHARRRMAVTRCAGAARFAGLDGGRSLTAAAWVVATGPPTASESAQAKW